ncbi:PH domain-containing protein [Paenibacillus septentrionalis]|uniref:PH domain-containing protein n=1 Tax=Paenibacillus septentrionalis TaxID=429342 RepID=A0ABW1V902_9BACL
MQRELARKLHPDYVKASKVSSVISHAVILLLVLGWLAFALWKDWTLVPVWIAGGVVLLSFVVYTWIVPVYEYRSFSFEVFEEEIEIKSGIIFHSNILVPMVRVQHIEVGSGPVMRKYKLASVTIVTAATKHEIKGLDKDEAEALKQHIGELAKVDEQHD